MYTECTFDKHVGDDKSMAEQWFKDEDLKKRKKLEELFYAWKEQIKTKGKIQFKDDGRFYPAIDYFVTDGFYPGYFKENNIKVLFIGREARDFGDRVILDLDWFGKYSPNPLPYWRRILYLVYGIKTNGQKKFYEIPYANKILKEMQDNNNFGFAIMNISKYGNGSITGGRSNFNLINQFLRDSELDKHNFITEEIELLEPDIIITANLWDGKINTNELNKIFNPKNKKKLSYKRGIANLYDYKLNNNKTIKLIDLYHFSKPGSDQKLFYDPVMELLNKIKYFNL